MLEWKDSHTFSYPWKLMVEAAYRKYPNPYSSHVHSLDTAQRRVTGSLLYSCRLFCTMWNIPTLVRKVVGSNPLMHVKEQSVCDLEKKTLTIHSQNMTLSNLFTLKETLEYSISEKDPSKTVLRQSASIDVHGIPLLGQVLENVWLTQYKTSISKGRLGIQSVADNIFQEQCVTS